MVILFFVSRPSIQRQSSTSSNSGSKGPRLAEPIPTPASFPTSDDKASLMEAPTFYPTEKDFQDPMEYIERIKPIAEQFGLCRIVPPSSFKVSIPLEIIM
jgi:protein Jumonji